MFFCRVAFFLLTANPFVFYASYNTAYSLGCRIARQYAENTRSVAKSGFVADSLLKRRAKLLLKLGMNWAGEVVAQALLAQMRGMELPSHPSLSSARGFGPAYEL